MIATAQAYALRHRMMEHRTEPRILLQMEPSQGGNSKLKPTVFLPSALMRPSEPPRHE